jgi:uncharacterized protein (TIGR02996 family)
MIAEAVAAAERADWSGCLTTLLEAWRATRQPELAELVERVGARVAAPAVRPEAKAIKARIATATDADITQLTTTIVRQLRTSPTAIKLGVELAKLREPDPRIATMLAAYAPFGQLTTLHDQRVVEALDAIDDPRYRELIVIAAEALAPRRGRLIRRHSQIDAVFAISAAIKIRRPAPSLATSVRAAIKTIDEALRRPTPAAADRATLLAAIYREPDNLAARLVYADALLDDGDVRGEFITLQCARARGAPPTPRERKLLADHERLWLGDIEPYLLQQGVAYRHGFVAEAELAQRAFDRPPIETEWQTLERLELGPAWGPILVRWLAGLPNLRQVMNFYAGDLTWLVAKGSVAWTTLGVRGLDASSCRLLGEGSATLPALCELELELGELSTEMLESLGRLRLARLRLLTRTPTPGLLAEVLRVTRQTGIPELVFAPGSTTQRTRRARRARRTWITIRGSHAELELPRSTYVIRMLELIPTGTLQTYSSTQQLDDALVAWFAARGINPAVSPGASSREA